MVLLADQACNSADGHLVDIEIASNLLKEAEKAEENDPVLQNSRGCCHVPTPLSLTRLVSPVVILVLIQR